MEHRRPVFRAAPQLPNGGVVYLAREAQQQAGEARQREAKQVVGGGRDSVHEFTIATAAGTSN